MTIWVVISVFNRCKYTEKCIEQLLEQSCHDLKIILVDDGSTDGTSEVIKVRFPEVELIQGDGNLYWTGAMHVGVAAVLKKCANNDFLLVVNDDLVFDENFVDLLLTTSRSHPNAMIHASNSFLDNKNVIDFGGRKINWWTAKGRWCNKGRQRSVFPSGHVEPSDVLWGRGLLVPIKILRHIGNYDRRFQQSGDPEFSHRAAKAGYDLLVAYDVVAYMYPETNPNINVRREYALSEFSDYFFGVLSQGRIKSMLLNSKLLTENLLQASIFFCFNLSRHLWHFFRHVRRIK